MSSLKVVEIMFAAGLTGPADFALDPCKSTVAADILKPASVFCCCSTGISNAESALERYHIEILNSISTVSKEHVQYLAL